MSKVKRVSIAATKKFAQDHGYDQIIIVAYNEDMQSVSTWGKSIAGCKNAADGGNAIKRLLGWPEDKIGAVPKRANAK